MTVVLAALASSAPFWPFVTVTVLQRLRRDGRVICRDAARWIARVWAASALVVVVVEVLPPHRWWDYLASPLMVALWLRGAVVSRRVAREHAGHDEDCRYGPRRRRTGSTARLRSWAKVAVNPAFAPT